MSRRFTGFPPEVKELIWERAHGRCERCNEYAPQTLLHTIAGPVVLAALAAKTPTWRPTGCGLVVLVIVGRSPIGRKRSLKGWLVRQTQSPIQIPVLYRSQWVLLDDDGNTYRIPNPVEAAK
ncbi:HNH endonuclease [Mycobacterium phage Job42]|uniref:HNH endonuclease n=1 Tax=Mycobacterium phage Job42 TaxID=1327771 RepID=UPI00034263D5|nr:HNH endonuclease [Mycobacterium phage Job42]AGM61484.1 HNH endonuclease domain protein [Mycobacterium phage Job42]